jgi:hypothetical protein
MKFIAAIKSGRIALLASVMVLLAVSGYAQSARLELKNLEKLSGKASEVTDVTLDGDLLQMAARFTAKSDDKDAHELSDLIKGLAGIYVKSFEFDQPNQYTQADVEAIRSQLAAPGWSRIVQSTSKRDAETNEIYLMKKEGKIVGVAILVAEPKELTVVNIVGPIDIEKLSELGGKFGVPAQIAGQPKHNKKSEETGHEKK